MSERIREKRNSERKSVQADMKFFVDNDILDASAVDLSEHGIRFDTPEPMQVRLRMRIGDEVREHEGLLVWAERKDSGGMTYGLEFIPDPEEL